MDKKKIKSKIRSLCRKAGTYSASNDLVIDKLADILADLDDADTCYNDDGRRPVVSYTNKAGAENLVKNPVLMLRIDLRTQAIAYMRELGLTAASLRKIKAAADTKGGDNNIVTLLALADGE